MKKINNSPSQAMQDSFVMNMLSWKKNGFYLEIGAFKPIEISNTYTLETIYNWSGVSLEINSSLVEDFNNIRKNKCYVKDATTLNYVNFLSSVNAPERIDYLQIDIKPAVNTLQALKQIPLDIYRFSVITFEHDLYSNENNINVRDESRKILLNYGYKLVIGNLMAHYKPYEDWYVDPSVVPIELYSSVMGNDIDYTELFSD